MKRSILRRLKLRSIQTTMLLAFLALIAVIIITMSAVSLSYTIGDLENLSVGYTGQLIGEINSSIDAYIDNMKSISAVVVENADIRALMAAYNRLRGAEPDADTLQELEELTVKAAGHMQLVANTRTDITNIAVISKYRDVVLSDTEKAFNVHSSYNLSDWFLRPLSYANQIFVSPSHVQSLIQGEYRWVISISRSISDPVTGEVTGVMVIDMNYRSIETICENVNMEDSGYIYLMDNKKNLIYHPQQSLIYSGIKSEDFDSVLRLAGDGETARLADSDRILLRNTSEVTGWIAVGVINRQNLIGNRTSVVIFYACLAYIAVVMAALCAMLISSGVTRPIRRLETTMNQVEQGDLSVRSELRLDNEIGHLSDSFNTMVGRLCQLLDDRVRNEEEKRRSEIMALQAQINPHFLYNTLDTIIWMSASGQNEEVVEVTSALAHLFQSSISQGSSLVKLDVELKNIQSYLTIQKMRYKDKLSFRIDVPPELGGYMTPKLILQPIVENAIYHGIKTCPEGGTVMITARRQEEELLILIEDTGAGMPPERLATLFDPKPDDERGIGVLNVHNRIRLVFGPRYGLRYESQEGHGTRVTLSLPAAEWDCAANMTEEEGRP